MAPRVSVNFISHVTCLGLQKEEEEEEEEEQKVYPMSMIWPDNMLTGY